MILNISINLFIYYGAEEVIMITSVHNHELT